MKALMTLLGYGVVIYIAWTFLIPFIGTLIVCLIAAFFVMFIFALFS